MACLSKYSFIFDKEEHLETMEVLNIPGLEQLERDREQEQEQEDQNRQNRLMRVRWALQRSREEGFQGDLDDQVERLTFLVDHYYELTTPEQQDEYQQRYFWARHQMVLEDFQGNGYQQDERLHYLMENYTEYTTLHRNTFHFSIGLTAILFCILWNYIL